MNTPQGTFGIRLFRANGAVELYTGEVLDGRDFSINLSKKFFARSQMKGFVRLELFSRFDPNGTPIWIGAKHKHCPHAECYSDEFTILEGKTWRPPRCAYG